MPPCIHITSMSYLHARQQRRLKQHLLLERMYLLLQQLLLLQRLLLLKNDKVQHLQHRVLLVHVLEHTQYRQCTSASTKMDADGHRWTQMDCDGRTYTQTDVRQIYVTDTGTDGRNGTYASCQCGRLLLLLPCLRLQVISVQLQVGFTLPPAAAVLARFLGTC